MFIQILDKPCQILDCVLGDEDMIYDEKSVIQKFENLVAELEKDLTKYIKGRPSAFPKGLKGWAFEQTIIDSLSDELTARGTPLPITEQPSIGGRVHPDLLVGSAAIELEVSGSYDEKANQLKKYSGYRKRVEEKGWRYLYLTGSETYKPNRETAKAIFGPDNTFFLDEPGDWKRFVEMI